MRFLRRKSTDAGPDAASTVSTPAAEPQTAGPGRTTGKGRPTPKRRDAEIKRRGPAPPPPRTQRESIKLARQNRTSRDERRKAAAERRGRLLAGDERELPARDRGPVKAFVRDIVDSRRHLMGLFLPLAGLVFVSMLIPPSKVQALLTVFYMSMLLAMVAEGVLLGYQITKRVRERFPKESVNGLSLGWYAYSRASQPRRLRVPKPRVSYGAKDYGAKD